ncbi:CrcB family protein [Prochlorococcus sp. MIT 0801]|uniref:fluoride efflux transporter FluC n=1 Tax=Prochlorococcus sp. MIT 0801 TaxID=1501269 RepID=UPI000571C891|nr:CrcB family protein [Prochlorococcus sp. MIT 0801]
MKNNTFFLVSVGAILGAVFRWQIDEIFIVNLIGCFLLGFFNSLDILKRYKLTLCVGLCGSMTTFSGWSFYLYKLLNQGLYQLFLLDSISIVLLGVLAIGLGHIFAKKLNA